MIISDLNYLESASEDTNVIGGTYSCKPKEYYSYKYKEYDNGGYDDNGGYGYDKGYDDCYKPKYYDYKPKC